MFRNSLIVGIVMMSMTPTLHANSELAGKEARSTERRPWQWTDDERLVLRMNDEAAGARVIANDRKHDERVQVTSAPSAPPYDVIDGRRDPHLFFEFELFEHLVALALADDRVTRVASQEMREEQRKQVGLPDDMWQQLTAITAAYRAERLRYREMASSRDPNRETNLSKIASQICRDRLTALAEAKRRFGSAFSEFLYIAVAPRLRETIFYKPEAAFVQLAKGECQ